MEYATSNAEKSENSISKEQYFSKYFSSNTERESVIKYCVSRNIYLRNILLNINYNIVLFYILRAAFISMSAPIKRGRMIFESVLCHGKASV